MDWRSRTNNNLKQKRPLRYFFVVVGVIGLAIVWSNFLTRSNSNSSSHTPSDQTTTENNDNKTVRPLNLQPILDDWLQKNSGTYSVVMSDLGTMQTIATSNANDQYFMASLYKLYVAYLGYLDIQNGLYSIDQTFLSDWSRGKCLDEMIRTSNSPCGEKLMAEQDRSKINQRIKELGMSDTTYGAFVTSAYDTDQILRRIFASRELNDYHTTLLIDSMKGNIYRDAIIKGAPSGVVVADKVGFRELVEYHDVAIVYLPDGRAFALSILTKNAGSKKIADLTNTLLQSIDQQ